MRERSAHTPPLPRGEGAGGEGRSGLNASLDDVLSVSSSSAASSDGPSTPTPPPQGRRGRAHQESRGWDSTELRQKDFVRANLRAARLRREQTPSERKLWRMLREEPNARFRRQVAIRDWVYDFGEFGSRLLIELDGGI